MVLIDEELGLVTNKSSIAEHELQLELGLDAKRDDNSDVEGEIGAVMIKALRSLEEDCQNLRMEK